MRKFLLVTLALAGAAAFLAAGRAAETASAKAECLWTSAQDAIQAAPRNHRVVLENDKVRVLDVVVPPHIKENVMHIAGQASCTSLRPRNMPTTTPTERCCSIRAAHLNR